MWEVIGHLRAGFRAIDLIDVTIVAFIVYRLLLLIQGTRAVQMLTGIGILGVAYFASTTLELFTTHWLLAHFFDYLIIIVIVVFQDDLRRALTTVGRNPFFSKSSLRQERLMVDEIARAAARLARERIGALIVIERETGLKNFIDTGSTIDAAVKCELIYSIFLKDSPLHDGALIIRGGSICAAGCFLPLSKDTNIDKRYGSRHRAAVGLSEETDALVVSVSEETGHINLARMGKMTIDLSEQELRATVSALLNLTRTKRKSFQSVLSTTSGIFDRILGMLSGAGKNKNSTREGRD